VLLELLVKAKLLLTVTNIILVSVFSEYHQLRHFLRFRSNFHRKWWRFKKFGLDPLSLQRYGACNLC